MARALRSPYAWLIAALLLAGGLVTLGSLVLLGDVRGAVLGLACAYLAGTMRLAVTTRETQRELLEWVKASALHSSLNPVNHSVDAASIASAHDALAPRPDAGDSLALEPSDPQTVWLSVGDD